MDKDKLEHKLEILNCNYWVHFKYAKDLAGYLDLKHPLRVKLENTLNEMLDEIHRLNRELKNK